MVPWVTWAQLAKAVERVEKYERHGFSFGPRERAEAALERATRFHLAYARIFFDSQSDFTSLILWWRALF